MKFLFSFLFVIAFIVFVFLPYPTRAENQIIITWQANNFYPADYPNKALATPNTPVTVAVELVSDNKLVDLSKINITWFLDENLLTRGVGLKETTFTVKKSVGDSYFLRVSLAMKNSTIDNSIRIPINDPVLVIKTSLPERKTKANTTLSLEAIPYFFNVSRLTDLSFSWLINGSRTNAGSDNFLSLEVGAPATGQNQVDITAAAQNILNPLEFVRSKLNLLVE